MWLSPESLEWQNTQQVTFSSYKLKLRWPRWDRSLSSVTYLGDACLISLKSPHHSRNDFAGHKPRSLDTLPNRNKKQYKHFKRNLLLRQYWLFRKAADGIIFADGRDRKVGYVLQQEQDYGITKPIGYWPRILTEQEKSWHKTSRMSYCSTGSLIATLLFSRMLIDRKNGSPRTTMNREPCRRK